MLAFIHKIYSRLRTYGLGYFAILARNEFTQPRFRVTRQLRRILVTPLGLLRRSGNSVANDALQFWYDLSVAPITFDFASYLAAAEIERRLRGLDCIDVFIVMGPHDGVREETPEYEAAVDRNSRVWRVRHILLPILAFLPTVRSTFVCGTHQQAEALIARDSRYLYPQDYRVFLPRSPDKRVLLDHARAGVPIWPLFRATEQGRKLAREFLEREAKGRKPIVITLRNYGYTPQRNSRNADWLAFADGLDLDRYAPIFVHDAETVMQPPPADFSRHLVCEAASVNLEIRMALYEAAWLNMALMAGPTELCWYNEKARYLLFIAVGSASVQSEKALMLNGHRVGVDLEFAKPLQHIVWEVDEVAILKREFSAIESFLNQHDRQDEVGNSSPLQPNSWRR